MTEKQTRKIRMAKCHPNRKHQAKGLCGYCYTKNLRKINSEYVKKSNEDARKKYTKYPAKRMIVHAKRRAKINGIEFDIEESDIIITEYCPLLNVKMTIGDGENINAMTLDRLDPEKGYIKGNIWVISHRANRLKGDATPEELIMIAEGVKKKLKENIILND